MLELVIYGGFHVSWPIMLKREVRINGLIDEQWNPTVPNTNIGVLIKGHFRVEFIL